MNLLSSIRSRFGIGLDPLLALKERGNDDTSHQHRVYPCEMLALRDRLEDVKEAFLDVAVPIFLPIAPYIERVKNAFAQAVDYLEGKTGYRIPLGSIATGMICVSCIFLAVRGGTELQSVEGQVLTGVSDYLIEASVSDDDPPVFFGTVSEEWEALSAKDQKREAENILLWLETRDIHIGFLNRDQSAIAQFVKGEVVLTAPHKRRLRK